MFTEWIKQLKGYGAKPFVRVQRSVEISPELGLYKRPLAHRVTLLWALLSGAHRAGISRSPAVNRPTLRVHTRTHAPTKPRLSHLCTLYMHKWTAALVARLWAITGDVSAASLALLFISALVSPRLQRLTSGCKACHCALSWWKRLWKEMNRTGQLRIIGSVRVACKLIWEHSMFGSDVDLHFFFAFQFLLLIMREWYPLTLRSYDCGLKKERDFPYFKSKNPFYSLLMSKKGLIVLLYLFIYFSQRPMSWG